MELQPRRLQQGVNQDVSPINAPEGTCRFLLNALNESTTGDMTSIVNERGTTLHSTITGIGAQPTIIGEILLPDDSHALFTHDINSNISSILLQDVQGNLTVVVSNTCLNFSIAHPIKGFARVFQGCQRVIYFIDPDSNNTQRNPPRIIDIDDILNNPTSHQYLTNGAFDCEKTRWFREFEVPNLNYLSTLTLGGGLRVGTYRFFLQYADQDLNGTAFIAATPIIPITSGIGSYDTIEGGDTNYPLQNKAIELNITNLDTNYPYYRIAVMEVNAAIGQPASYFVSQPQPIGSTSSRFLYTGANPASFTNITGTELLVPSLSFSFLDLLQMDNRAYVANIKEKEIDLAEFQRYAFGIRAQYVTKLVPKPEGPKTAEYYTASRGFMRDEVYEFGIVYVFKDGYETPPFPLLPRAAETYSDGTLINTSYENTKDLGTLPSPLAGINYNGHIRPNTPSLWDKGFYNACVNTSNFAFSEYDQNYLHLAAAGRGFNAVGDYQDFYRWEAYNTAIQTSAPYVDSQHYTKGEFAYFESSESYPTAVDCNNDPIYSYYDSSGALQSVAGQPVRLFKFPDSTLEPPVYYDPVTQAEYTIPIGVEFTNITYPPAYQGKIQGYKIVVTQRDANNRTVIDKGIVLHNWFATGEDGTVQFQSSSPGGGHRQWDQRPLYRGIGSVLLPVQQRSVEYIGNLPKVRGVVGFGGGIYNRPYFADTYSVTYHGPQVKFNRDQFALGYIKGELWAPGYFTTFNNGTAGSGCNGEGGFGWKQLVRYYPTSPGYGQGGFSNRKVTGRAYVGPDEYLPQGVLSTPVANGTQQEAFVIEVERTPTGLPKENIPYLLSADNTSDDWTCPDDWRAKVHYCSLKVLNYSIYGAITGMKFIPTDSQLHRTTSATIYGGDCFISQYAFRKTGNYEESTEGGATDERGRWNERNLIVTYAESTINAELRHGGDLSIVATEGEPNCPDAYEGCDNGAVQKYYPQHYNINLNNVCANDPCCEEGDFLRLDYCHTNYYAYNPDFSRLPEEQVYFSLPINFDYCLSCRDHHPFRVWHSKRTSSEEQIDSYRLFLANDYKDFPGNKGDITSIFQHNNALYVRTRNTTYKQIVKPVEMKTDVLSAYLGTGEPLSLPENELVTAENGYIGGISRFAILNTPYGTFIPDEVQGRVFLLQEGPQEISNKGLRNWFEENLPYKQANQLLTAGTAVDNTILSPGLRAAYDDRHKRVILTKRDFSGEINYSWTASYSFLNDAWMGWHSYLPNIIYGDSNTFYSYVNFQSSIWKHNYGDFQTYYGTKYDHIVEMAFPTPTTHYTYHVEYISNAYLPDTPTNEQTLLPYTTFDRVLAYNSAQSTGIRTLTVTNQNPYAAITQANNTATVTRSKEQWSINQLWDIATNKGVPLHTQSWSVIQPSYFIDKLPNPAAFTPAATLYQQTRLKDKYAIVRLFAKPTQNVKLVTDLASTLSLQSYH